jgi:hypothetical protein
MIRLSWALALSAALVACGGSTAGTHPHGGDGGTGGEGGAPFGADPADGFGGGPGVPVDLPVASWEIRSQLWAPEFADVPSLPGYRLLLAEQSGGCAGYGDPHLGPQPHELEVELEEPAIGDCPLAPDARQGCRLARVTFWPGDGRGLAAWDLEAAEADLRLDRFDGGIVQGELRAWFYADPEMVTGSGGSSNGESWLDCRSLTGVTRTCEVTTPGEDCCNAGKPLEEVAIRVDAAFCPTVASRWGLGADTLERAAACSAPPVDCDATCAAYAGTCGACADCAGDDWCEERWAERCAEDAAACPAACAAAARQPVTAVAMACLAAGATCDGWGACLAGCGGAP